MKNITYDFEGDWIQHVKSQIKSWGFQVNQFPSDVRDILYLYHSIKRRLVSIQKREVIKSANFLCPEKVKLGYLQFCEDCTQGRDLNKYLSKSIQDLYTNDAMLNDWGIHHFHLGEKEDSKNTHFIARTKELLFAIITNSKIYCIGIFKHEDWTDQSILDIIENNWPFLIEAHKIKGENITLAWKPNDNDLRKLRKNNINTPAQTSNGNVYITPGGGINASGGSTQAFMRSDYDIRTIKEAKKYLIKNCLNI
ncbi:hypothetical protein [Neisseria zalophi]|uniref:Uncharacterized protein n=1 Tax=Neisseria zalophi TaxID=640030 RepID=A0A5J6PV47_9NEIS|nr:hypothetical protein [Neisseria zalophi]QEY26589.1 hypothetical protein D0T92_08635 [Neisseria zalophi]